MTDTGSRCIGPQRISAESTSIRPTRVPAVHGDPRAVRTSCATTTPRTRTSLSLLTPVSASCCSCVRFVSMRAVTTHGGSGSPLPAMVNLPPSRFCELSCVAVLTTVPLIVISVPTAASGMSLGVGAGAGAERRLHPATDASVTPPMFASTRLRLIVYYIDQTNILIPIDEGETYTFEPEYDIRPPRHEGSTPPIKRN